MAHFLPEPREQSNHLGAYDAKNRTLRIEITPDNIQSVDFPLRPGTFEHLRHDELREVALFLKLKGRRSDDTLRRYSAEMEKFLVFLKVSGHHSINEWVILEYQDALLQPSEVLANHPVVTFNPTKPETADQYLNVIRSFVQQLTDKNLLAYNSAKQVPGVGIKEQQEIAPPSCFTDDQWQTVLDALSALPDRTPGQRNRKERFRFCFLFSYALALRVNEMARHMHSHITLFNGEWVLKIIGKGLRARRLTLTGVDTLALDALTRYRTFLHLPPTPLGEPLPLLPKVKPVLIKTKGPNAGLHINQKPNSKTTWEEQFKAFLKVDVMTYLYGDNESLKHQVFNDEWGHLTPHSLRHTRITHLVKQGKDLFWVQRFAGHENLNTTRRYFHTNV